ncbi:MAG: DUF192 domain-containing protein [Gammaproteobacteria bacterium]|nr:DUF192 domain-containing protein [Gammaproteobacteria bacterium]MDE0259052.1 DUF192 domain-containing protein [Gammaproteobacteria bacterium]
MRFLSSVAFSGDRDPSPETPVSYHGRRIDGNARPPSLAREGETPARSGYDDPPIFSRQSMLFSVHAPVREGRRSRPARPGHLLLLSLFLALPLLGCRSNGSEGDAQSGPEASEAVMPAGPGRDLAWVIFGADTVVAEVARTPDERSQGLKDRDFLAPGAGMIFVFSTEEVRSFWMQDTFIPLDIAYLDANARIIDIQQMEPETTRLHTSSGPAMFALEVPQGWFAEMEIAVGAQAEIVFGT